MFVRAFINYTIAVAVWTRGRLSNAHGPDLDGAQMVLRGGLPPAVVV
ncbi:MAG: hypothetical protein WBW13_25250 [Pseudolabrys sp.]